MQCNSVEVLTDGYQHTPPNGWRLIKIYPTGVNMALEPSDPGKLIVLCHNCFASFMADLKTSTAKGV
jgi:hypothetical protein